MGEEQDSGFIRQRRNLMVVSLVLLFSEISALSITKLSIFGNEIAIDHPRSLNLALWIAALYWLWRFYQYSRPYVVEVLKGEIYRRSQEICRPTALKVALRRDPTLLDPFPEHPSITPEISIKTYTFHGHMPEYLDMTLELNRSVGTKSSSIVQGTGDIQVRIEGGDLRQLRLRSWIHLVIHTRHFTDYVLPYVLFSLPLFYGVYKAL